MAQLTAMDIRLIRAFIASPGGLRAEREAAHAVARQVNRSVARELGGRLELIGWEETLSGSGRPQAMINADMESCDLFIGAIWTRWGIRPSLEGPYTSGFEEEFELSRERCAKSGSPTMAMFFKDIDQLQLDDPGDELKKVLAFQEKLQQEKAFLYDTFATPEQFSEKVREFLTAHTIRLLRRARTDREERIQAEPLAKGKDDEGEGNREAGQNGNSSEVTEARFLIGLAETLGGEHETSSSEVARLRLIAIVSGKSDNDKLVLGAHDANLLYQERKAFKFSFAEKRGLVGAGFAALNHENVPLWTWLADVIHRRPDLFTALTLFGEDAERAGALTAMLLLGKPVQPLNFLTVDPVSHWLGENTGLSVKAAALRYLRELGGPAHLPAIESEIERAATETLALGQEAALAIYLRADPAGAARYLLSLSFETLKEELLTQVLQLLDELGTDALAKGLDHRSAPVRQRTLELLSARGALDLETIDRAREDGAALVRLAAIHALETLGQPLSIDEAYKILSKPRPSNSVFGFHGTMPDSAGLKLFNRYRARRLAQMELNAVETLLGSAEHRDAAYLALAARRIGDFPERLRNDLRDHFKRYAEMHWPEGIRPPLFGAAASLLSLGTTDPLEAKRRDLTRDALETITRQRDETDLPLVRQVLGSGFVGPTPATVAYLRTLGDAGDIAQLSKTTRASHWWEPLADDRSVFVDAARAILRLQTSSIEDLMGLGLPAAMRAELIAQMPGTDFAKLSDGSILALLLSETDEVRRAAAIKVPASLSRSRVRKILAAYRRHKDGRYYVVTYWLDLGLAFTRAEARRVALTKTVS